MVKLAVLSFSICTVSSTTQTSSQGCLIFVSHWCKWNITFNTFYKNLTNKFTSFHLQFLNWRVQVLSPCRLMSCWVWGVNTMSSFLEGNGNQDVPSTLRWLRLLGFWPLTLWASNFKSAFPSGKTNKEVWKPERYKWTAGALKERAFLTTKKLSRKMFLGEVFNCPHF